MIHDGSVFQLLTGTQSNETNILKLHGIFKQKKNTETSDSVRNSNGYISISFFFLRFGSSCIPFWCRWNICFLEGKASPWSAYPLLLVRLHWLYANCAVPAMCYPSGPSFRQKESNYSRMLPLGLAGTLQWQRLGSAWWGGDVRRHRPPSAQDEEAPHLEKEIQAQLQEPLSKQVFLCLFVCF